MSADYLFISCHHADGEALEQLSRALAERGINTCSSNGTGPTVLTQALAMAVCLGPQGLDQRQKRDIGWALARQVEAQMEQADWVFPIIPVLLPEADLAPAFLFRHAWVDLRYNLADSAALDRLAQASTTGPVPQRPIATLVDLCPYRGLLAFREEDAAFFFGREAVTERLLAEVASRNLIALVGPIGSGKSSVINAGLLPLLRRQGLPGLIAQSPISNLQSPISNPKWEAISFTPGHQPFHRLAAALNNLLDPDLPKADRLIETRRLGDQLAQGEARLEQVVEHALALNGDTDRLLLVVDQFEELVALTPTSERRLFVEILLQALQQPKLSLLLALRANFYGDASLLSPELSQYLERSVINLGPLTRAELERVMVKPTRPVTLAFEPGLVERMLNDVEQAPSQLPLLEFTLAELWRHHQGGLLRQAVYDQIGQVNGAIAYRAEQLWHTFSANQQLTAQRLLTRLMRLTQDGQPIYERVSLTQLASELEPEESGQMRTVLEAFAEVQLLLLSRDEVTDERVVQIAHETLTQHWPRWQNWLKEEREFLLWRQRLQGSMVGWERVESHPKNLLRGAALLEAEQWLAKRRDRFDAEGRVYIWQSLARWNWERDLRWLISLGMVLTLILIFVITIAQQNATFAILRQERNGALEAQVQAETHRQEAEIAQATAEVARREAELQRQVTLARFLAIQAQTELDDRLDRAMLLAIESLRRLPSAEGERALHHGLALLPHPIATIQQGTEVNALIFSPDGQWLVTGGKSAIPRVWQTATGRYVPPLGGDQGFPISASIQLSAHPTPGVTEAATDRAAVVAFSPDERWLATGSWNGVVRIWSVETSQLVAQLIHGDAVTALAFSPARPDGTGSQWLAVGSWAGSVRIWPLTLDWMTESAGGELIIPPHPILREEREVFLKAHKDVILAITFSPDGRRLVTTSADNTARLWDVAGMFEQYQPLPPVYSIDEETWQLARLSHESAVWSAAFSPDGHWLATGSSDRSVRLWDISDGSDTSQEVARLPHPDDVKNVAFSPDGLWLVTVSADNVARVWLTLPRVAPAGTARQPVTQMAHSGQINAVVFSPNSRWLATASADHTARLWEVATGQEVAQMAHDEAVLAVAFSPTSRDKGDHQWIATASRDGVTRVWEATTGQEVTQLEQSDWILGLHFSPDGHQLAARSREMVRVWTMETGQLVVQMAHSGWIHTADFSADGRWLATGSGDKMARIWEVATGAEVAALAHPGQVQIVAFNPAGRQLATASRDHIVRLWNVAAMIDPGIAVSSRELQLVHRGWVYALDYSPDGRWLATASADKTARIWDVETGQEVARLTHDKAVLDVAFSPASPDNPSSRWLATASADHTVRLWSVSTGREVARLIHEGRVEEVLFSPDGRHLASKSRNIVQVWDVARPLNAVVTSEQELARLSHPESVRAVAFSPDGQWLATTTGNPPGTGSAYLWKAATGEKVTSRSYEYWVTSVAFSPDGRWLVTGGGDRQAHIWLLQPKDLITEACARLTRNLTRLEWQQYLGDEPYRPTCPNLPFG